MKFVLTGLSHAWKRNCRQKHVQEAFKLQPKAPLYQELSFFHVTSVTGPFQPLPLGGAHEPQITTTDAWLLHL